LSIYEFGTLAILHCFILNEDLEGRVNTPKALQGFLDETKVHETKKSSGKKNQVDPAKGNTME